MENYSIKRPVLQLKLSLCCLWKLPVNIVFCIFTSKNTIYNVFLLVICGITGFRNRVLGCNYPVLNSASK